jgi:hypothetical protein
VYSTVSVSVSAPPPASSASMVRSAYVSVSTGMATACALPPSSPLSELTVSRAAVT